MVELLKNNAELITRYVFISSLLVFAGMMFVEAVTVIHTRNMEQVEIDLEIGNRESR